jgi:hypothetical protein
MKDRRAVELAMFNALSVIVQTPEIREWMLRNDPRAYQQAQDALRFGHHLAAIMNARHDTALFMNRAWDVRENWEG